MEFRRIVELAGSTTCSDDTRGSVMECD